MVGLVCFWAVPPFTDAPLSPTSSPLGSVYKKTASWQRDTFHISRTVRRTDGQTSLLLHNSDQVSCRDPLINSTSCFIPLWSPSLSQCSCMASTGEAEGDKCQVFLLVTSRLHIWCDSRDPQGFDLRQGRQVWRTAQSPRAEQHDGTCCVVAAHATTMTEVSTGAVSMLS